MWVAYGFCNQQQHAFLATDLTPGETDFDPEEVDLTLHAVTVADFEAMVLAGQIKDCCTLAAWGLYKVWQQSQPPIATPIATLICSPGSQQGRFTSTSHAAQE